MAQDLDAHKPAVSHGVAQAASLPFRRLLVGAMLGSLGAIFQTMAQAGWQPVKRQASILRYGEEISSGASDVTARPTVA